MTKQDQVVNRSITSLFKTEIDRGISVVTMGRQDVSCTSLTQRDEFNVRLAYEYGLTSVSQYAPQLALWYAEQRDMFVKWGSIAKACLNAESIVTDVRKFDQIGVSVFGPRFITCGDGALTSYRGNSWSVDCVSGEPLYLFGREDTVFKPDLGGNAKAMFVLAEHGLFESPPVGAIESIQVGMDDHMYSRFVQGPYVPPAAQYVYMNNKIVDMKTVCKASGLQPPHSYHEMGYSYNTRGVIPVYPDVGARIEVIPNKTVSMNAQWFGLVFYTPEYGEKCGVVTS